MTLITTSCIRCVGDCISRIKYGKTKAGNQRYLCKICHKTKVENYLYKAYLPNINTDITVFTKEGLGIRSTARILKISSTTLLKRIIIIAKSITKPIIPQRKEYEVDEMCTYVGTKRNFIWIVYALEKVSKKVVVFSVGKRTNKTLNLVLETLKRSEAAMIATDRLKNYCYLIEEKMHSVKRFGTNPIERKNLTLRTHLKRLNRRSICCTKSEAVLIAILQLYFWS